MKKRVLACCDLNCTAGAADDVRERAVRGGVDMGVAG